MIKTFNREETDRIREMISELKPVWNETRITRPSARLPSIMPDVLGKTITEAVISVLESPENPNLRRECAFVIWDSLPDSPYIHRYDGFHIIADALDADNETL